MKLYYNPGVCSLSPHIVLAEAGFRYELEHVDLNTKKLKNGGDYLAVNDKGSVPLLELEYGERLTEGPAIVQYLADLRPERKLAPKNGTFERARLQEWLNYIGTELHKAHGPLFHPEYGKAAADAALNKIKKSYDYVSSKLEDRHYLMGDEFTVADAYLFTIINWHNFIKLDLAPWPVLVAYQKRVASRPMVQVALREEGLIDRAAA